MPRIGAVVFDMDGLMFDTEAVIKPCFQSKAAEFGCEIDDELYATLIGRGASDCCAVLQGRFGSRLPAEAFDRAWKASVREQLRRDGIPIKAGLHALLDVLEAHQIPVAVATSTDREEAYFCLRLAGIYERFAVIVTGDEVHSGKPEPDIYLQAASRLAIVPTECVALEDSSTGVLAASRAGMTTLMVPDAGRSPSPEARAAAFAVLPSLNEAAHLMCGWLRCELSLPK